MSDSTDLSALIDGFHEAALEPRCWQPALARLGAALGGSGVVVVSAYDAGGSAHLIESVGYDRAYWERVQAEHSTPGTNRYIRMINAARAGEVLQPRAAMSLDEWLDDPIYQKFLRPDGLGDGLTCPLFHRPSGFAAIATFRGEHYDRRHVRLLQAVAPHIRHALHVHMRLQSQDDEAAAARGALGRLRAGVILCDAQARVIYANPAALALLEQADGLSVGPGGLLAAELREDTRRLKALVRLAGETALRSARAEHAPLPDGGPLLLARKSGMAALQALVTPLRSPAATPGNFLAGRASVMISLVDPDAAIAVDAALLRQMHGLTGAQSRLALHLLQGRDLPAAALAMGVGVQTARTLLKRAFERTGTHRQADLVARILAGPLGLVASPH